MNILMVGVDRSTKGGMWTVVENYLNDKSFTSENRVQYVPTFIVGSALQKLTFMLRGFCKICGILHREKVDLVHVHMSERASVFRKGLVMWYARRRGAKILLHMHGAELEDWYQGLSGRKQHLVQRIVSQADRVVILGDYWREFMSELVDDPEKIRVVHNAVPLPEHALYRSESRILLFLGAVSKRKGIYDLLDAMQKINSRLPREWQLMIYGPTVIGSIEEEIARRELSDRVHYCGWLPPQQREAVLSQTAVNLLPSLDEGLPMTILEAMAAGIPSVTTRVAAIPEAVDQENGILLQPGDVDALADSILEICLNSDLRMAKSQACRRRVEQKFSLAQHIAAIEKIYKELADLS